MFIKNCGKGPDCTHSSKIATIFLTKNHVKMPNKIFAKYKINGIVVSKNEF